MRLSYRRFIVKSLSIVPDLTLAYRATLVIAALMAVVSMAGLALGARGLYGPDPLLAVGVTPVAGGLLVPGWLGQDAVNLVVGVPILLGSLWLARRGSLIGLLLLPGALFYVLYTYTLYLVGAPFSVLFLLYVPLATLSAYVIIGLLSGFDREQVRQQLSQPVSARLIGGLLVVLALLTLAQDASGALLTALGGAAATAAMARPVWIGDLAVEAPAVLVGGVLLWRRRALGYAVGPGLLLQYGLTPIGLVANMALGGVLTQSPLDVGTSIVLLAFGLVCFVPLAFFVRGAVGGQRTELPPIAGSHG